MKKNLKSIEGYYYSTYAFVFKNNLEATANKVLGKGWEAEDDVDQIAELANHSGLKYVVIYAENRRILNKNLPILEKISVDNS